MIDRAKQERLDLLSLIASSEDLIKQSRRIIAQLDAVIAQDEPSQPSSVGGPLSF
jgi:hypothetical protein